MHYGNNIRGIIILGMLISALPVTGMSQQESHLWNITDSGDTLQYVNIFASDVQQDDTGFPKYMTPEEFRAYLGSAGMTGDSIAIQANVEQLFQSFPENREMIQPLEPQYESIWKPVVAATVSGALSAYFKLEANAAYERYNRSIDRSDINRYYDLTRKYDTYSAISFVFLQASFGWLSYKLLR